jgi:hypothetical protein
MNVNIVKHFAGAVLISFLGIAKAETTGNDLYGQFKSSNSTENLQAQAYLLGVLDAEDFYLTVELFSSVDPKSGKPARFKFVHFCFGGDKVTLGQLSDIVIKYLETHPEKRHIRAHSLIRFALLEDFACANNPSVNTKR